MFGRVNGKPEVTPVSLSPLIVSAPSVPSGVRGFGYLGEVPQLFSLGFLLHQGLIASARSFVVEHTPPDPPGESAARENEVTPCVRHVTWITEFRRVASKFGGPKGQVSDKRCREVPVAEVDAS